MLQLVVILNPTSYALNIGIDFKYDCEKQNENNSKKKLPNKFPEIF